VPGDWLCGVLIGSRDQWGMQGHTLGHQAPLTRSLEAARAACSTTMACQYHEKSMKIIEKHEKSLKTIKNH